MNSNKDLSDAAAGLPSTSSTANIMANVSNLTRTRSLRLGNSNTRTNGLFNECYPGGAGLARSGSFRSSHRPSLAQLPSNTSSIGGNHLLVSPSKHRESLMSRSTYSEADRVIELDIEGKTHRINVNRNLNSLLEDRNSKFNAMIEKSKDRQALMVKISELEKELETIREENNEVKENLEFISSERNVLSDAVKELEESLTRERVHRQNEKESLEDLASHSKVLYDKVCSKKEKIKALEEQLVNKTQQIEELNQQKEDKMAALELLIEAWIELEAVIKHNQSGEDDGTVKDDTFVRPKNEMELMNSMKKSTALMKNTQTEVTSLKNEIRGLVQENLDLKKQVRDRSEVDKFKKRETQLKQELDDEKERVTSLMEEIDNLKERLRCTEVISNELKRQVKEVSTGNNVASNTIPAISSSTSTSMPTPSFNQNNNNPSALKQELKTVKEVIASREEMIQKLNDKYMRHRQVWEENERRANDEIKKLDEIIDRVVMTLSNCTPFINDCAPLKRLLEELTADQQNISNLSSTFV